MTGVLSDNPLLAAIQILAFCLFGIPALIAWAIEAFILSRRGR